MNGIECTRVMTHNGSLVQQNLTEMHRKTNNISIAKTPDAYDMDPGWQNEADADVGQVNCE
jgi:hypothetical protein